MQKSNLLEHCKKCPVYPCANRIEILFCYKILLDGKNPIYKDRQYLFNRHETMVNAIKIEYKQDAQSKT